MRCSRLLLFWISVSIASTAATAGFASNPIAFALADCVPPTISYDAGEVRRGETIRVIGTAWGDDCLDTPGLGTGDGPLGRPLQDIELFIRQGTTEVLVASGAADDKYAFEVNVVVPPELAPGPAAVVARSGETVGSDNSPGTLTISAESPISAASNVASFGPDSDNEPSSTSAPDMPTTSTIVTGATDATVTTVPTDGSSTDFTPWIFAAVAAVVVVAAAIAAARSTTSSR